MREALLSLALILLIWPKVESDRRAPLRPITMVINSIKHKHFQLARKRPTRSIPVENCTPRHQTATHECPARHKIDSAPHAHPQPHRNHTHSLHPQTRNRAAAVQHRLVQISSRHRTVSSPQPRSFASTETVAVLQWPGIGLFRAPRQNMYVAPGAQEPLAVSLCEPSSAPPFVNLALHHLPLCTFLFSSARNDGGETNPHNDGGETNPTRIRSLHVSSRGHN